jgi:hypothetical protein
LGVRDLPRYHRELYVAGNQKWTVPVGASVTWTSRINNQPMSFALAYYTNVEKPQFAPQTQLRFVYSLIFPVKRK